MDNVTHIGDWVIQQKGKRYRRTDECAHKNLEMDDEGEIVKCTDCGVQVSAYWALNRMIDQCRKFVSRVENERAAIEKTKQEHLHLIAAKKVEKAWRSRSMVPTCPHCHRGIFPQDGFGGSCTNRAMELRRRAVDEQSGKQR